MPLWSQHLLVLLIVAAAAFVVVRNGIAALRGASNRLGSCCAKGCAAAMSQSSSAKPAERIVFIPLESLARRKPRA
jgi:hypothetical protein